MDVSVTNKEILQVNEINSNPLLVPRTAIYHGKRILIRTIRHPKGVHKCFGWISESGSQEILRKR